MEKYGVLYSFSYFLGNTEYYAYRLIKDGAEEYVILEKDIPIKGLIVLEAELGSMQHFDKTEMYFITGIHHPFFKKIPKQGYFSDNYTYKKANETSQRKAVEALTYEFGEIVDNQIITRIGSRWRQKSTKKMLEYVYFDTKHLHQIYKK